MEHDPSTFTRDKANVFTVIFVSLLQSGLAVAAEEQPAMKEARMALETCYMKESTLVGLRRCDPPPLLVNTMQDTCLAEKAALRKIAVSTSSELAAADSSANVDEIVDRIILELQPKIHATLVSAQSRHGC